MADSGPLALDVRHLRLLAALGRTGALARAAAMVHLSPSAVSRQLSELERLLGVALFRRGRRGLSPTPAGARLVNRSTELLEALRLAEASVRETAMPPLRLRVATECYTSYHWLPQLLAAWRATREDVAVELVLEATPAPLDYLRRGALDIAITTSSPLDRRLSVFPLFEDELVAIVAPAHRLRERSSLTAADFVGETLLAYRAPSRHIAAFERSYFGRHRPARLERLPLTEAIVGLVEGGLGLGIVTRWAVEPALRAQRLVALPLAPKGIFRRWVAVTRRADKAQALIGEALRRLAGALGPPRR